MDIKEYMERADEVQVQSDRCKEMRKLKYVFGVTLIRGIWASEKNPHRDGVFVRKFNRRGNFNNGWHVEVTDGKGEFWEYPMESIEIIGGE